MKLESIAGIHRSWWIMVGCCFMMACGLGLMLNASGIFFTPVAQSLGCGMSELSFYLTCYFICMTISSPLVARGLAKWNFKVTLAVCWTVTCAAYIAMGFYTEVWMWYITGCIYGLVGNFVFMVPAQIMMENWFDERGGTALGIAMAFSGIGGAIASFVGVMIIESVGWQNCYIILGIAALILVLPWIILLFDKNPEAVGLRPYGYDEEKAAARKAEAAITKPGVPFKAALLTVPFICLFLFGGVDGLFAGYNSHLPTFAITIGHTAAVGAMIVSLSNIGFVVFSFILGPVIDKFGVSKPTFVVFGITIMALLAFMFSQNEMVLYVAAFFFGSNMTAITVSLPKLIAKIFGLRDFEQILPIARMGNGIIGMFGPLGCGLIYDMTGQYTLAFVAGIVVMVLSALLVAIALLGAKKLIWKDGDNPARQISA